MIVHPVASPACRVPPILEILMKRPLSFVLLAAVLATGCKKAEQQPAAAAAPAKTEAAKTEAPAADAAAPSPHDGQRGQPSQSDPPAPAKPIPAKLPNVLARLNGEPVERWELENAVKRAEARAGSPIPSEKRDEILRGVLDQLVAYHLL